MVGQRESLNGAEQVRGPLPDTTVLSHSHLMLHALSQKILYTLTLVIVLEIRTFHGEAQISDFS